MQEKDTETQMSELLKEVMGEGETALEKVRQGEEAEF